ncbi:MAG TPA: glucose-6-phosphate dehydrogenase [Candidatus Acidoferrum sp.]|nr:glucose-6-phosphate dehydrogenase [Candidatus Acidoferrum sp.]
MNSSARSAEAAAQAKGQTTNSAEADAYYCEVPSAPCAIVIFGASGDLARRKLFPALYDLARHACLAPRFRLLGFARTPMEDDAFREHASEFLPKNVASANGYTQKDFQQSLCYFTGDYDDPQAYQQLGQRLEELDREGQLGGNRLFYLAVPPEVYLRIVDQLGKAGLQKPASEKSWTRVIIEKPFGEDLASCRDLNARVLRVFDERQVFRIDHYLGKETVQNLLVFRFGNGIFEPLWNRNYIDHVQITAAEALGVESRAAFYESAGALRDMVQSHMLQLTALTAMEAPATFDATPVRNEKLKVLQSIRSFANRGAAHDVVRGQHGAGTIDGKPVPGYREEKGVKRDSTTETFVALKLFVDNWRWSGVPFYLRTGKRLKEGHTEIAIQFKQAPHKVFREHPSQPNWLILNVQPNEGISLSFGAKAPGSGLQIRPVTMDFRYRDSFGGATRDAYATLINDCIRGDATLFDGAESVEAAWQVVDPIRDAWKQSPPPQFPNYATGSEGPEAAQNLMKVDQRQWRPI